MNNGNCKKCMLFTMSNVPKAPSLHSKDHPPRKLSDYMPLRIYFLRKFAVFDLSRATICNLSQFFLTNATAVPEAATHNLKKKSLVIIFGNLRVSLCKIESFYTFLVCF